MQTRRLGRTGHQSSLAILGGAAFAASTPDDAEAHLHMALDKGVNHLDVAPRYGDAELALGPHVPAVRDRLFLACKTAERERDGSQRELERTMERFGTDQLDLYQAHAITDLDELDRASEAFETITKARDEGLTRFAGVTGHDLGAPKAHLEACKRYDLDTVMFPIYPRVWADPVYRADAQALLDHCIEHDIGVQIIKSIARRPWGETAPTHRCWYEPWTDDDPIVRGLSFALSTPGVTGICTVGDLALLPRVLDLVAACEPLTEMERSEAASSMDAEPIIFPLAAHFRRDA
jgi:predicted aldo/keto reductase-like oxidoreductase